VVRFAEPEALALSLEMNGLPSTSGADTNRALLERDDTSRAPRSSLMAVYLISPVTAPVGISSGRSTENTTLLAGVDTTVFSAVISVEPPK
jgi:hypothetical protein